MARRKKVVEEVIEEVVESTEEVEANEEVIEAPKKTTKVSKSTVEDKKTEEEAPEAQRQCLGLFVKRDAKDFTQNKNYCDDYLKSKGLFK